MKHKASISQVYIERDNIILPQLFELTKACISFPTTMREICKHIAEIPQECYYISEDSALYYVRKRWLKGKKVSFVNKYKQKLYEALYEEILRMMKSEKYKKLGLKKTTIIALTHPAPCIGMHPSVIMQKIYAYIKSTRSQKYIPPIIGSNPI